MLVDHEQIKRVSRQQLGAGLGDEHIVDDARPEALLGREHGRLDRDHHAGAQHILAAAEHVQGLPPRRRHAGADRVAGGVQAVAVHARIGDHALGRLVRHDGGDAVTDLRESRIEGGAGHREEIVGPTNRIPWLPITAVTSPN